MNAIFYLLAQRGADSPVNKWLGEHPVVLGIIFLVIGGALALSGVYELWQGVARDKDGTEIRGFTGQVIAVVRVVAGLGFCGWAIYKMIMG